MINSIFTKHLIYSASTRTPLPFANNSYCLACSGLSPPSYYLCRAHNNQNHQANWWFALCLKRWITGSFLKIYWKVRQLHIVSSLIAKAVYVIFSFTLFLLLWMGQWILSLLPNLPRYLFVIGFIYILERPSDFVLLYQHINLVTKICGFHIGFWNLYVNQKHHTTLPY